MAPPARTDRRPAQALAVVSAATLLVLMTYTAPMTVLQQMAGSLHAGPAGTTWLLNGITLGLAATLLVSGSVADNLGRRRTFQTGTVLLALSALAAAAVPGAPAFIAARVIQGAASAAILAAGLGLIGHAFPPGPALHGATARWGAMLSAGIAAGPIVSAGLARLAGWRAFYLLVAVLAGLLALAGHRVLDESRAAHPDPIDTSGALTLGTGLALLLVALTAGRTGWLRPTVGLALACAVTLLAAFVTIQRRSAAPMVDPALFRRPTFRAASTGALFTGIAVIGPMSVFPTTLQHAVALSPLGSALLFAAWSGVASVVSPQVRRLGDRLSGAALLAGGFALYAAGELAMLGYAGAHSWSRILSGLVISGTGSGVLNATLARMAVESVPRARAAMGSGANNTARYIGAALGVSVAILVPAGDADAALVLASALGAAGALAVLRAGRATGRRAADTVAVTCQAAAD